MVFKDMQKTVKEPLIKCKRTETALRVLVRHGLITVPPNPHEGLCVNVTEANVSPGTLSFQPSQVESNWQEALNSIIATVRERFG